MMKGSRCRRTLRLNDILAFVALGGLEEELAVALRVGWRIEVNGVHGICHDGGPEDVEIIAVIQVIHVS